MYCIESMFGKLNLVMDVSQLSEALAELEEKEAQMGW